MAEYPAMTLWTDAYLADTRHLSTEEHGAYLLLLMAMWRSPDGWLQDDDQRLARMAGVGVKRWKRIRPALDDMLTVRDGKLSQKRLLEERERAETNRNQKRQAGKASAQARAPKSEPESDKQEEVFEIYSGHATADQKRKGGNDKPLKNQETGSTDVGKPLERKEHGGTTTSYPSPSPSRDDPDGSSSQQSAARPIPKDWWPDDADWQAARALGLADEEITDAAREFVDFWDSKRRQAGGKKRRWSATFRNRIRDIASRRKRTPAGQPSTGHRPGPGSVVSAYGDLVSGRRH